MGDDLYLFRDSCPKQSLVPPGTPRNHEDARSALACGSEAAALEAEPKAVADATALQGALGTTILRAEAQAWKSTTFASLPPEAQDAKKEAAANDLHSQHQREH
jgi:hypothetical protein